MTGRWQDRAACQVEPDLWLSNNPITASFATHVCHSHCPVLSQCQEWTSTVKLSGVVAGGCSWSQKLKPNRKRGASRFVKVHQAGCHLFNPDEVQLFRAGRVKDGTGKQRPK